LSIVICSLQCPFGGGLRGRRRLLPDPAERLGGETFCTPASPAKSAPLSLEVCPRFIKFTRYGVMMETQRPRMVIIAGRQAPVSLSWHRAGGGIWRRDINADSMQCIDTWISERPNRRVRSGKSCAPLIDVVIRMRRSTQDSIGRWAERR